MAADWYVRISNVERGPISSETLKHLALEGRVTPQTAVRKGAGGTWVSAGHVKGLFAAATEEKTPPAALPHQPPPLPAAIPIPAPNPVQSVAEDPPVQRSTAQEIQDRRSSPIDVYHAVLPRIGAAWVALLKNIQDRRSSPDRCLPCSSTWHRSGVLGGAGYLVLPYLGNDHGRWCARDRGGWKVHVACYRRAWNRSGS